MTDRMRRSDLVASLATVAISSLSGPLGGLGVAVAKELLKACQSAWDRNAPERRLRDSVQASIEGWVAGERVARELVDRGLGWAVEYVQGAGCPMEVLADADFDPARATSAVLDRVQQNDRYWGTEAEYAVAERAVTATYHALCAELKAGGGGVLAAVQASRHAVLAGIEGLRDELVGAASRDGLIRYLRHKVKEWDFSPWTHGKVPSQLERKLRIDTRDASRGESMPARDALNGVWLLAVLGGPGSGKTWLAQRFAREAAEAALEQLLDPRVDPMSVEVPVLTTWAEWAAQRGGGVDALAASALPAASEDRIRISVLRRGARVLAVADSLDEGVGESAAKTLLRSLTGLPGWRVVVTSRPEAWNSAAPVLTSSDGVRVGTLVDLAYPDDVSGYIQAWFVDEPSTAAHLVKQIEQRHELQDTATVPLLLTFYCMLTEQDPARNLPERSRELYRAVIKLLLSGRWSGDDPGADSETCLELLQEWAWEAVREAVTETGLGAWPSQFSTKRAPQTIERAIDHVAPKQRYPTTSTYDHELVERRFLHRTLWEHLVAEQIATFPATTAAEALLPHVWFDQDWAVTVPMAIAAHPDRDDVLDQLWTYHSPQPTPAQTIVNLWLQELLLNLAAQSYPSDWNFDHNHQINTIRVAVAPTDPGAIARSAHWVTSNTSARKAILSALPTAKSTALGELIGALRALGTSEAEWANARQAILNALPATDPWSVKETIVALHSLDPSDEDLASARQVILNALPTAEPWALGDLVTALALVSSDADRARTRQAILDALSTAEPWALGALVGALPALVSSDADRARTRQAILDALLTADRWGLGALAGALPALRPTEIERASARQAILAAVPTAGTLALGPLVGALPALVSGEADRASVRQAILDALPNADPWTLVDLVSVLRRLEPGDGDRSSACQAVLDKLPTANLGALTALVDALPTLVSSDKERSRACQAVLDVLPTAGTVTLIHLVGVLPSLALSDNERSSACQAVLGLLPTADPVARGALVSDLAALASTDADRSNVFDAILSNMPTAEAVTLIRLVGVLPTLASSVAERTSACQAILKTLPTANPEVLRAIANGLPALVSSDADRRSARQAILNVLPTADPRTTDPHLYALRLLTPVAEWLDLLRG